MRTPTRERARPRVVAAPRARRAAAAAPPPPRVAARRLETTPRVARSPRHFNAPIK
jgi:hypothetical protein